MLEWTKPFDHLVRTATTRFPLLASVTPTNAAEEQNRLISSWSRGIETSPRWDAPNKDREALAAFRRGVDEGLRLLAGDDPWRTIYRERLIEIAADLAIADSAFEASLSRAADARFGRDVGIDLHEAEELARTYLSASESEAPATMIASDDIHDPSSLVSRMRAEISARRLGVRVVVRDRIGALAAAGDGVVVVAAGRRISAAETERVVLHEIEGHVVPRERGRQARPAIMTLGSANASEDEEGRALLLEERAGLLGDRRRRTLGARDRAARLVLSGGTYVEVVRALRAEGVAQEDALAIASRVMRGGWLRGSDVLGGLARERVYLPALVRVRRAVAREPSLLEKLGRQRLSLAASALLV
ncbi:MAG: tyrosine/phenylalanine carboxypeptidase domain-containing protein [Polyangiales bacterium]